MEKVCFENAFVLKICSIGGFPLKQKSELGYRYNKGTISWINCVIVLYIFLFLLIIVITYMFLLCIIHLVPYIIGGKSNANSVEVEKAMWRGKYGLRFWGNISWIMIHTINITKLAIRWRIHLNGARRRQCMRCICYKMDGKTYPTYIKDTWIILKLNSQW